MAVTPSIDIVARELKSRPQDDGPDGLRRLLETYLSGDQIADVDRAYHFGAEAHEGQHRLSGEPYIYHPIAVARILAEMRMDAPTIIAAILHDVIEDTPTARDQIEASFGEEVAALVDGVSKLTQIKAKSKAEVQAESFRKMMLAMVEDIRVIMIKLADRLHNMRTLAALPRDKRRRIARETLDIYAPIAARLGMNGMRRELEDLGFATLYPMRYRVLSRALKRARGTRKEVVSRIEDVLRDGLGREGIEAELLGREKHLYSLYRKMRTKELSFSEVLDVYAFRVIVDKVDTCYRVLGVVHGLYKPVPGRFKDYIAIPKANGYQSLHTVLFGPHGVPIEIQIRTAEMDRMAESGVAVHWLYKESGADAATSHARAREWLHSVLEMQKSAGSSLEFLENVKVDLFPDEVYVFTPRGAILRLPRGATAVDFAYAVHTDVGNTCVAAKIDRRLAPLSSQLVSGQTVEIVTAPSARPNPAWLNFVVTARARANIRHFLKNLRSEDAAALGQRMMDRALAPFGLEVSTLPDQTVERLLEEHEMASLHDLLQQVGLGERMAPLLARRTAQLYGRDVGSGGEEHAPLSIHGTEGMVVTFARCCHPIPGDRILGYLSSGRGVVIHTENCRNLAGFRKHPEKWIEVQWDANTDREFPAAIRMDVANQRGVLATLAAEVSRMESNIEHVEVVEHYGGTATLTFVMSVRNREHLARILRRLRAVPPVIRIQRTKS